MEALDGYYLLAIGLVLIAIDSFILSFFVMWIGAGMVLSFPISYLYHFDNIIAQLSVSFFIGLIFLFSFNGKIKSLLLKTREEGDYVTTEEYGVVVNGKIKMEGTLWTPDFDITQFQENEKLKIRVKNNKAYLLDE